MREANSPPWSTATQRATSWGRLAPTPRLARSRELTGARLLTLHNLTFIAALMERLRAAIVDGCLAEVASALRSGSWLSGP